MLGFPLGILSAAGAGGVAGDYELIETEILGTTTASVTFDSLATYASTYKHLQIRMVTRDDRAVTINGTILRFNEDTGSNYSQHALEGNGTSVSSSASASTTSIARALNASNNATADAFVGSVIDILDPFATTKNTTVRIMTASSISSGNRIRFASGAYFDTDSLTSIFLAPDASASYVAGSRFSLYGVKG